MGKKTGDLRLGFADGLPEGSSRLGGAGSGGTGKWLEEQMNPTPTLLPSLRFHDLVFGQELGQGTFSVVR